MSLPIITLVVKLHLEQLWSSIKSACFQKVLHEAKSQLILKCPYGVFKSTKKGDYFSRSSKYVVYIRPIVNIISINFLMESFHHYSMFLLDSLPQNRWYQSLHFLFHHISVGRFHRRSPSKNWWKILHNYLINIWQMFNAAIDNLAVKPYIPHKSLFQWICCKCLAW